MAINNSDGSIVLSTKVDTSGLNKGMSSIKNVVKSISSSFKALAQNIASGLNKGMSSMKSGANSVSSSFKALARYIAAAFSLKAILQFSKASSSLAIQTEASVQRLIDIYGQASDEIGNFIDENARAIGMSKSSAASFASVYGNLFSVWADQSTNAELTMQYLNMTAVVASKTGRTVSDVQERIRSGLLGNTEAIEDLGIFVNVKTIEMTNAFKKMANGKSWEQLNAYEQQQVRTLAILEQSTQKYGDSVSETSAMMQSKFNAAYEDLQATWGQFVNTVLMPILSVMTEIMDVFTRGMQVIMNLSGKTIDNSVIQNELISDSTKNQNALTDAVKETQKAQKGALAGFDEVNTLTKSQTSDGINSTSSIASVDIPTLDIGNKNGEEELPDIDGELAKIMAVVGSAMIAIGLILLFTGNIGWGIGFIIAGASTVAVTMAATGDSPVGEEVNNLLNTIMIAAGLAMLAIGIIICCLSGPSPIGIGLIITGAATLAAAVALNYDAIVEAVQGPIGIIMAIVGGALLAIGIILCCVGVLPLGIALIIVGAAALVTVIAINSNAIVEAIQGPIGIIMAIVGGALLVIGIILCVTGVGIPLGIALILAGAAALATPIALNWNAIVDKIKSIGASIGKIFSNLWEGIKNGFKAMVNGIIGFANLWIDGLNLLLIPIRAIIYGVAKAFGSDISFDDIKIPHIPKLARGAVVPPNREFMAVLGDNTRETEIVSPLSTMEQAFENVLSRMGGINADQDINVSVIVDSTEIARATRKGENRLGKQTVFGGFANAH